MTKIFRERIWLTIVFLHLSTAAFADTIDDTRKAAEQGDAEAQFNLGNMYRKGEGVPKDIREALKWYRLATDAAKQGDARAQFTLGLMYHKGEGVPKDIREALKWYRLAAEQGDAEAQLFLGMLYDIAGGVPDRDAIKWYRLAAEQGDARAQLFLGIMYVNGKGVPRDDREAVKWFRLAAEQGDASAQFNLGNMYASGKGVPEDDRGAFKWYRLAAEQGLAEAQFILGGMYYFGEGVPKNYQEAYIWYSLAAASGIDHEDMTMIQSGVEQELSRTERSAAQKEAARRWKEITEQQADKTTPPSSSPVRDNITQGAGGILHFAGVIEDGDARRLETRIKAGGVRAVAFNSNGGKLSESMAIGRLIRDNLIRTEVPHYAECYSACVIAFVGGVERVSDGSLGIHSFYSDEFMGTGKFTEASEVYDQVSNELEAYLKEMRIPLALLDHMKRVSHKDMDILDTEKRREYFLEGTDPVYQQTHKE